MIDAFIKMLSKKINEALNNDNKYTIYTENVKQDLKLPCFFVYCKNYANELYRGKVYREHCDIAIEYFPKDSDNINADINSVIEHLYQISEYIEYDNKILYISNRSIESTESGILFNTSYEHYYQLCNEDDLMLQLKERSFVKNGR